MSSVEVGSVVLVWYVSRGFIISAVKSLRNSFTVRLYHVTARAPNQIAHTLVENALAHGDGRVAISKKACVTMTPACL